MPRVNKEAQKPTEGWPKFQGSYIFWSPRNLLSPWDVVHTTAGVYIDASLQTAGTWLLTNCRSSALQGS